jgi:FKBP-type peptidyl-prolyl cis-trans isomerase
LVFSACNEDKYADWKILNEQWMTHFTDSVKANDSTFVITSSGICYKVIHEGNMRKPSKNDAVKVNYTGKYIDGTKFDSGTYFNYLSGSIPGWQEVLTKVRDGSNVKMYIPASMAYGEDGRGDIPPHSTLIFDVILIESFPVNN